MLLYIVMAGLAMFMDNRSLRSARAPTKGELRVFALKYLTLFGQPVTGRVLDTVHLSAWEDAYSLNRYPDGKELSFWQKMYVRCRYGVLYNVRT